MSTINSQVSAEDIKELCDQILKYNYINPDDFNRFNVKRGLRNSDGTGVMAGISRVCSVEGYYIRTHTQGWPPHLQRHQHGGYSQGLHGGEPLRL